MHHIHPGTLGGWNRMSELLKLELWVVGNHYVAAGGNQTWGLSKSKRYLTC